MSYWNGKRQRCCFLALVLWAISGFVASTGKADNEWANWRGPLLNGTSNDAQPPATWSPDSNIAWKAPITGLGSSTPIVWGKQVIVLSSEQVAPSGGDTSADVAMDEKPIARMGGSMTSITSFVLDANPTSEENLTRPTRGHRFLVTSFDLETGAKNWETAVVREFPHEPCHVTNNFASSSPVTDGKSIYVFFGSRGLFCLDMAGKVKWRFDHGQLQTIGNFGEGASPALFGKYIVIPWDNEAGSCLIAMNASNGYIQWKVPRNERTNWATPVIVEHNGVHQVIVSGRSIRSYELETGRLLWSCPGQTEQAIPTPIVQNGRAIVTSGFRVAACYAVSLDAMGTLNAESTAIQWSYNKDTPYVPSPCCYQGKLYLLNEKTRRITILDEATGDVLKPMLRLSEIDTVYASLGAANGNLYVTDRMGKTVVIDTNKVEMVASNELGETIDASPVFVGKRLLMRGEKHLYCLMDESESDGAAATQ
jgi:outer membrane protein assembly factor BamB